MFLIHRRLSKSKLGAAAWHPVLSTVNTTSNIPIPTKYLFEKMVKPIPENIKNTLSELSAAQQVAIRGYIGTLRAEIKGLEEEIRTLQDPDPHAHYHGHEKCTADHGHASHGHEKDHESHEHCKDHGDHHHAHDHKKEEKHDHDHSHAHKEEHDHHAHEHHDHHEHSHGHGEKCTENHDHHHHDHDEKDDHKHDHHGHEHEHSKPAEEEMPAWKKRALDAGNDPTAAPFGGNWNAESSLSATDGATKMEE